jgi:hypothetical protein
MDGGSTSPLDALATAMPIQPVTMLKEGNSTTEATPRTTRQQIAALHRERNREPGVTLHPGYRREYRHSVATCDPRESWENTELKGITDSYHRQCTIRKYNHSERTVSSELEGYLLHTPETRRQKYNMVIDAIAGVCHKLSSDYEHAHEAGRLLQVAYEMYMLEGRETRQEMIRETEARHDGIGQTVANNIRTEEANEERMAEDILKMQEEQKPIWERAEWKERIWQFPLPTRVTPETQQAKGVREAVGEGVYIFEEITQPPTKGTEEEFRDYQQKATQWQTRITATVLELQQMNDKIEARQKELKDEWREEKNETKREAVRKEITAADSVAAENLMRIRVLEQIIPRLEGMKEQAAAAIQRMKEPTKPKGSTAKVERSRSIMEKLEELSRQEEAMARRRAQAGEAIRKAEEAAKLKAQQAERQREEEKRVEDAETKKANAGEQGEGEKKPAPTPGTFDAAGGMDDETRKAILRRGSAMRRMK